jgi:hypothetical protein
MREATDQRGRVRVAPPAAAGLLLCLALHPAAAQIGYPPDASPYRDIARGRGPVLHVDYLTGGRGVADIGLTNLLIAGARVEFPLGAVLRVSLGASFAQGERYVLDPAKPPAERRSGPEEDQLYLLDGEALMSITGQKTWHGLAPYVVAGAGIAFGGAEPAADNSAYRFGIKPYLAPGLGVRWYLSPGFNFRADARLWLWRLRYPSQFYSSVQGQLPILLPTENDLEWVQLAAVRLSVGWIF